MGMPGKRCLFCQTPAFKLGSDNETTENATGRKNSSELGSVVIKEEVVAGGGLLGGNNEDSCLEEQLKAIFILRNLLGVERDRLEEYFGNCGGRNPGEWFGVCARCNGVVEECYKIIKEITRWNRKLERKRLELRGKVEETGRRLDGDLTELFGDTGETGINHEVADVKARSLRKSPRAKKLAYQEVVQQSDTDDNQSEDEWQPVEEDDDNPGCTTPTPEYSPSTNSEARTIPKSPRKKGGYRCTLCVASFTFNHNLTKHLRVHELQDKVECAKCGWVFKSWKTMSFTKHHLSCPIRQMKFKCSLCPAVYPSQKRLEKHLDLHQNPGKQLTKECKKCGWLRLGRRLDIFHAQAHKETDFGEKMENLPYQRGRRRRKADFPKSSQVKSAMPPKRLGRRKKRSKSKAVSLAVTSGPEKPVVKTEVLTDPVSATFLQDQLVSAEAQLSAYLSLVPRHDYQCIKCIASYKEEHQLRQHLEIHDLPVESVLNCAKCGWTCRRVGKRVGHFHRLEQCPAKNFMFQCTRCNNQLLYKDQFVKHLERHVSSDHEVVICQKPNCSWKGVWYLIQRHRQESHVKHNDKEDVPFYCDHCHFIFIRKEDLARHFKAGHKDIPLLQCDICKACKLESRQLLDMHRKLVHGIVEEVEDESVTEKEEEKACLHCSEKFESKTRRDYHIALCHKRELHICPICKAYHAREFFSLKLHMQTHDKGSTTICEFCSKVLRNTAIKTHLRLFHYKELGLEQIQCAECGKRFTTERMLKNHQDFIHNQQVSSCCPLCPKQFQHKNDLEQHIKSHQEPKQWKYKKGPFFCQKCPSQFNVRQGLYYHMKKEHSNQYPYRCDKCGKGYSYENTLLEHQKKPCKK